MTRDQAFVILKIQNSIHAASSNFHIPPERMAAHAWQESTWNEEGTNNHVVSFDGGQGLWQIQKGVHPFADDSACFDIWVSTQWAGWFLAGLKARWQDWEHASMAYNGDPSLPVVQDYGNKITALIGSQPWVPLVERGRQLLAVP